MTPGVAKLSYIEVTNAQHFDAFIGNAALPGFDTRFIPLHVYFNRAMDAMYDNLKNGKALPPSQVVRTTPRGGTAGAAPAITAANVLTISACRRRPRPSPSRPIPDHSAITRLPRDRAATSNGGSATDHH